ncbi:MAG: CoA-binding protein [Bacteroidetes bacterium]|nr:MAG: CoA-binding protein [Bacteroidota bacterium]
MAHISSIKQFTSQKHIAVAGISRTPHKFGNAAFKELKKKGYTLYPISHHLEEFEGVKCYRDVSALPDDVSALLISTKPDQTRMLLDEARRKGIRNIWLQQGSADKETIREVKDAGDNVITGECILMFAEPAHFMHRTHAFFKKLVGNYPA